MTISKTINQMLINNAKATPGNWSAHERGGCVASDTQTPLPDDHQGEFNLESYGGVLVCESTVGYNAQAIASDHHAVPKLAKVIDVLANILIEQGVSVSMVEALIEEKLNA